MQAAEVNKWTTIVAIILFVSGYYSNTGDLMVGGLYASYVCLLSSVGFIVFENGQGDVYKQLLAFISASMIVALITVTSMHHDNISKLHVSGSFFWFNLFIMLSVLYASFMTYISPYITALSIIWFTSIIVMLYTQTTDGFTGINL